MSRVVVVGEAVADAIVATSGADATGGALALRVCPGGGPANTAVALSRLGTPTQFLGRLSDGSLGRMLQRHLTSSMVDISRCVHTTQPATLAITTVDAHGKAEYEFYLDGTADWQWTRAELDNWRHGQVTALHTGSLALTQAPGAALIENQLRELRPYLTISIDPNVRTSVVTPSFYQDAIWRWARLADIVRFSDDDLAVAIPGLARDAAAARLHEAGVRLVVATLGADGAYASLSGQTVTVPAATADSAVVDTVGAGDSFTAGLLHRLDVLGVLGERLDTLTPAQLADAMRFASTVAGLTCRRRGADPPWAHELDLGLDAGLA